VAVVDGAPVPVPEGGTTLTREQRRRNDARQREEYPDERVTIDALYAAGDIVTSVLTHRSTHRSGKAVTRRHVMIHRLAGGKVVELWSLWDRLGVLQQLGIVPETPELIRRLDAVR
jgi:predicted ester cyclase